jgi:hypothetical protein
VYASEALLLAFGLKMRVAAALAGLLGPRPRLSGGADALGAVPLALDQAAGFLGQCMPMHVLAPGSGRPALRVSAPGLVRWCVWGGTADQLARPRYATPRLAAAAAPWHCFLDAPRLPS